MKTSRRAFLVGSSAALVAGCAKGSSSKPLEQSVVLHGTNTGEVPEWAILQRRLIAKMSDACQVFYDKYFDERGYFLCFERWGANDGPDDAIENLNGWPLLHAIGAPDKIRDLYNQGWEGHLQQFTEAKTVDVPIAREGMFYKEFTTQLDWQHLAEELTSFNVMGLSEPGHSANLDRVKRFAGLYMGEDPEAPNWDPKLRIIKSMMNGSRGPMLRDATALDWAGDPFDTTNFFMVHGEDSYEETLHHYDEYTEVIGDHPLNLFSTTLALNAFALSGDGKYRDWLLGYVDAWAMRAEQNDGILPSNVGLDGQFGSSYDGKWYAGTYGWGFSPYDPVTEKNANRNRVPRTIIGFFNAYLLTNDDRYLDVWRKQTDVINAQQRVGEDGQVQTPIMYGDEGWYGWRNGLCQDNGLDIWWFSMKPTDRARAQAGHPWVNWLEGKNADWPVASLQADLLEIDDRLHLIDADETTAETRLADAVLDFNPAVVTNLLHQTMGAIHIARPSWSKTSPFAGGAPLYARLRHFNYAKRRAGLPDGVAALVTGMTDKTTELELVNLDADVSKEVVIQGGGYAEHQIRTVEVDGEKSEVDASFFRLMLAPGAVVSLSLEMDRYINTPTLAFPWDRA